MIVPTNLLILTSHFAIEPKDVKEGISYRCAGLYGSLVKALLKRSPESRIFWYSDADHCLRTITESGFVKTNIYIVQGCSGHCF